MAAGVKVKMGKGPVMVMGSFRLADKVIVRNRAADLEICVRADSNSAQPIASVDADLTFQDLALLSH